ncbi:MAG: hypothetical protein IKN52_16490 [Victivallales bacterium]|nr:hypothetical protein [Victivallales bacterium]
MIIDKALIGKQGEFLNIYFSLSNASLGKFVFHQERKMAFSIINIHDVLDLYGFEYTQNLALSFQCPLNTEIEQFIHDKAIPFARQKIAVTYFILNDEHKLAGYFALAGKLFKIACNHQSNTFKNKILKHGTYDADSDSLLSSSYLIAQFGKNFNLPKHEYISGNRLMELAFEVLQDIQRRIGGGIVFLECEDNTNLLGFYQNHHFKVYGSRLSSTGITYLQLMRFF